MKASKKGMVLAVVLAVLLVGLLVFTSCITQEDRENPVLKKTVEEGLWQPIPTSVGYSALELLLIVLKRQEVINQKLDRVLEVLEGR